MKGYKINRLQRLEISHSDNFDFINLPFMVNFGLDLKIDHNAEALLTDPLCNINNICNAQNNKTSHLWFNICFVET